MDDGSTDGSREIIQGYGERIVPVLKENGGQASAFNAGFASSTGEIVIFLDADDYLAPEAAQRVAESWRPGLSKIQYLLEVVNEKGEGKGQVEPFDRKLPNGDLRDLILSQGLYASPPTSGNAFDRDALNRILPMPEKEWRICADGYIIMLTPLLWRGALLVRDPRQLPDTRFQSLRDGEAGPQQGALLCRTRTYRNKSC